MLSRIKPKELEKLVLRQDYPSCLRPIRKVVLHSDVYRTENILQSSTDPIQSEEERCRYQRYDIG